MNAADLSTVITILACAAATGLAAASENAGGSTILFVTDGLGIGFLLSSGVNKLAYSFRWSAVAIVVRLGVVVCLQPHSDGSGGMCHVGHRCSTHRLVGQAYFMSQHQLLRRWAVRNSLFWGGKRRRKRRGNLKNRMGK